jgi:hypothetical protein
MQRAGRYILFALLILIAIECYGIANTKLFPADLWQPEGPWRFIQFAGLYAVCATVILILAPWLFAGLVTAAALAFAIAALGPMPVLAVPYFLLSCWCLGRIFSRSSPGLLALLLGLSLYLLLMQAVVRLPVNYPAVYLFALAIPIALRWRDVARLRFPALPLERWSERVAFAALTFFLATLLFSVPKPETGADALSMHLAIPMSVAAHHQMLFQPERWFWAGMPMGGDFVWTIAYLLGGEFAARALNFAMLLVLLAVVYGLMIRWTSRAGAYFLLALFVSTPMVQWVTGSLFVESVLAALIAGVCAAFERRQLYVLAIIGGAAACTKFWAVPILAVILPFAFYECRRAKLAPRVVFSAAALLAVTAAIPYAIAWAKTGDPLFPFLDRWFHSPLVPAAMNLSDVRYREPLTWHTPYDLTFHTHNFYEARDGTFGVQYLLLAGIALLVPLLVARRESIAAAIVPLGGAALILLANPNARYVYALLPLIHVPCAILLAWAAVNQRPLFRVLLAALGGCLILNAALLPSYDFYFRLYGPVTQSMRRFWMKETAPIRTVIERFNRDHPGAPVLLAQDSFNAGLEGEVYENHWHQSAIRDQLRRADGAAGMRRLLDAWQVQFLISRRRYAGYYYEPQALGELIENCAIPEYVAAEFFLAGLERDCNGPAIPSSAPSPRLTGDAAVYDDFSPYILFRGGWRHDDIFPEAVGRTESYTDVRGAAAAFSFRGSQVIWSFTRAPNRGIASVSIDGVDRGMFDLYSPQIQWRSNQSFPLKDAGPHRLVIRATGDAHPAAEGRFVDIDSFEVKP